MVKYECFNFFQLDGHVTEDDIKMDSKECYVEYEIILFDGCKDGVPHENKCIQFWPD